MPRIAPRPYRPRRSTLYSPRQEIVSPLQLSTWHIPPSVIREQVHVLLQIPPIRQHRQPGNNIPNRQFITHGRPH